MNMASAAKSKPTNAENNAPCLVREMEQVDLSLEESKVNRARQKLEKSGLLEKWRKRRETSHIRDQDEFTQSFISELTPNQIANLDESIDMFNYEK